MCPSVHLGPHVLQKRPIEHWPEFGWPGEIAGSQDHFSIQVAYS